MSNHGENNVHKEGEIIEEGQSEQAIPLPIPPCTTPPVPTVPFLSVSEWIEGNSPRQEAIMAALMHVCATTLNYTFGENATDINRIMVLGCWPVAETLPGQEATDSIILELNGIWPPGTHPPTISMLGHSRDVHST